MDLDSIRHYGGHHKHPESAATDIAIAGDSCINRRLERIEALLQGLCASITDRDSSRKTWSRRGETSVGRENASTAYRREQTRARTLSGTSDVAELKRNTAESLEPRQRRGLMVCSGSLPAMNTAVAANADIRRAQSQSYKDLVLAADSDLNVNALAHSDSGSRQIKISNITKRSSESISARSPRGSLPAPAMTAAGSPPDVATAQDLHLAFQDAEKHLQAAAHQAAQTGRKQSRARPLQARNGQVLRRLSLVPEDSSDLKQASEDTSCGGKTTGNHSSFLVASDGPVDTGMSAHFYFTQDIFLPADEVICFSCLAAQQS